MKQAVGSRKAKVGFHGDIFVFSRQITDWKKEARLKGVMKGEKQIRCDDFQT